MPVGLGGKGSYEAVWRLVPPLVAPGSLQMAVDWWLWDQLRQGLGRPALRFYSWSPVAISLGYHQRRWPQIWEGLEWQGQALEMVRRPTGGRAVLHHGDLTYMVVGSGLGGDRPQTYRAIVEFLIQGWRKLGLDLQYGQGGRGYAQIANCFAIATPADLVLANGTKFIGSAQLWRGNQVLQHGSMRLNPDQGLFQQIFGTSLSHPCPFPWDRMSDLDGLIRSLLAAAGDCWQVEFEEQPLSEGEWQKIRAIAPSFQVIPHPTSTPTLSQPNHVYV